MKELQAGNYKGEHFFKGESDDLTAIYDYDLLSSGIFQIIGKMVLHYVFNGCRGIAGLSTAVKSCILSGSRCTIFKFFTV